jgi:hypothetical protein
VITRDDLDDVWQLRDLDRTLQGYVAQAELIDAEMVEALTNRP